MRFHTIIQLYVAWALVWAWLVPIETPTMSGYSFSFAYYISFPFRLVRDVLMIFGYW